VENYLFKILLGGCVGHKRTEIMSQLTTGQSHSDTKIIIGVDFAVHKVDLPDNGAFANLQIWDFGEEERFRTLVPCFCQGAAGALLFFDLMEPDTLFKLEDWIHLIRSNTPNIPIIVCGANYHQLDNPTNFSVTFDCIQEFIQEHRLSGYRSISVTTEHNIAESFEQLTALMIEDWKSSNSSISNYSLIETLLSNQ